MSTTDNALRWIGDLDHPFYDDERQRFIWYEASAIGFQLFMFVNLFLVGAMLWVGGYGAMNYAFAVLMANNVAVVAATSYAKNNYAEYKPTKGELLGRSRSKLLLPIVAFMAAGFVRALVFDRPDSETPSDSSFGVAEAIGFAFPIVLLVAFGVIFHRREKAKEQERELLLRKLDEADDF